MPVISKLNFQQHSSSHIPPVFRNHCNILICCSKFFIIIYYFPKTHHQTPMTCTYGFSHFRHFQNCCNRDGNTIFKYMNYVPIVVATDLEVHFSVLKKGVSQYFCLYSVCTSHWCLVMSFWLKVCIYSHPEVLNWD